MALTPTAERMLSTLPDFYESNLFVERVLQAWANEIDRADARIDALKAGMVPGVGDDELGMLSMWEAILDLPIAPAGTTVEQRQGNVSGAIRRLDATTAAQVLDLLIASIGPSFGIQRNTPGNLQDTISVPFAENTYNATRVIEVAGAAWPAHRGLFISFSTGFLLDLSELDSGLL